MRTWKRNNPDLERPVNTYFSLISQWGECSPVVTSTCQGTGIEFRCLWKLAVFYGGCDGDEVVS